MTRWFIVSFFVACLICFIQAFPQSAGEPAASTTARSEIESALSDVMESLQKGFKHVMEDPGLNKLVQDGQKVFENAASSIRAEAAKIVPKTE